jgi:hypothetical protein
VKHKQTIVWVDLADKHYDWTESESLSHTATAKAVVKGMVRGEAFYGYFKPVNVIGRNGFIKTQTFERTVFKRIFWCTADDSVPTRGWRVSIMVDEKTASLLTWHMNDREYSVLPSLNEAKAFALRNFVKLCRMECE